MRISPKTKQEVFCQNQQYRTELGVCVEPMGVFPRELSISRKFFQNGKDKQLKQHSNFSAYVQFKQMQMEENLKTTTGITSANISKMMQKTLKGDIQGCSSHMYSEQQRKMEKYLDKSEKKFDYFSTKNKPISTTTTRSPSSVYLFSDEYMDSAKPILSFSHQKNQKKQQEIKTNVPLLQPKEQPSKMINQQTSQILQLTQNPQVFPKSIYSQLITSKPHQKLQLKSHDKNKQMMYGSSSLSSLTECFPDHIVAYSVLQIPDEIDNRICSPLQKTVVKKQQSCIQQNFVNMTSSSPKQQTKQMHISGQKKISWQEQLFADMQAKQKHMKYSITESELTQKAAALQAGSSNFQRRWTKSVQAHRSVKKKIQSEIPPINLGKGPTNSPTYFSPERKSLNIQEKENKFISLESPRDSYKAHIDHMESPRNPYETLIDHNFKQFKIFEEIQKKWIQERINKCKLVDPFSSISTSPSSQKQPNKQKKNRNLLITVERQQKQRNNSKITENCYGNPANNQNNQKFETQNKISDINSNLINSKSNSNNNSIIICNNQVNNHQSKRQIQLSRINSFSQISQINEIQKDTNTIEKYPNTNNGITNNESFEQSQFQIQSFQSIQMPSSRNEKKSSLFSQQIPKRLQIQEEDNLCSNDNQKDQQINEYYFNFEGVNQTASSYGRIEPINGEKNDSLTKQSEKCNPSLINIKGLSEVNNDYQLNDEVTQIPSRYNKIQLSQLSPNTQKHSVSPCSSSTPKKNEQLDFSVLIARHQQQEPQNKYLRQRTILRSMQANAELDELQMSTIQNMVKGHNNECIASPRYRRKSYKQNSMIRRSVFIQGSSTPQAVHTPRGSPVMSIDNFNGSSAFWNEEELRILHELSFFIPDLTKAIKNKTSDNLKREIFYFCTEDLDQFVFSISQYVQYICTDKLQNRNDHFISPFKLCPSLVNGLLEVLIAELQSIKADAKAIDVFRNAFQKHRGLILAITLQERLGGDLQCLRVVGDMVDFQIENSTNQLYENHNRSELIGNQLKIIRMILRSWNEDISENEWADLKVYNSVDVFESKKAYLTVLHNYRSFYDDDFCWEFVEQIERCRNNITHTISLYRFEQDEQFMQSLRQYLQKIQFISKLNPFEREAITTGILAYVFSGRSSSKHLVNIFKNFQLQLQYSVLLEIKDVLLNHLRIEKEYQQNPEYALTFGRKMEKLTWELQGSPLLQIGNLNSFFGSVHLWIENEIKQKRAPMQLPHFDIHSTDNFFVLLRFFFSPFEAFSIKDAFFSIGFPTSSEREILDFWMAAIRACLRTFCELDSSEVSKIYESISNMVYSKFTLPIIRQKFVL